MCPQIATTCIISANSLHVVHYENLKANPIQEVVSVLRFCNLPIDRERLSCLKKHKKGPAYRGQRHVSEISSSGECTNKKGNV